jgi:hypothetical protein
VEASFEVQLLFAFAYNLERGIIVFLIVLNCLPLRLNLSYSNHHMSGQ